MSRKPRKCRICRKRPVWRGGDVKDPEPFCKKCYHKSVSTGRTTAKHHREREGEREVFFPDPWYEPEAYTQNFDGWSDFNVMLDVFYAGEVFEDAPRGHRADNVPPGWLAADNHVGPAWVNEVVTSVASPVFEPTRDDSPPPWLSPGNEGPPPSWPEKEAT